VSTWTEIAIIVALTLVNGLLAGAEIAIVALRKSRLEELVSQGRSSAIAALRLRNQPERFLATVQVGITICGATAAAFGGSRLAADLLPMFERLGLGRWAGPSSLALVVVSVSYLSVVLGELVPKSLGLRAAERYGLLAARPLLWLAQLARPLVWALTLSSNAVLRVFGDRTTFTEARLSVEELRAVVDDAARLGTMSHAVGAIASRALDFSELTAADVMLHRRFVVALSRDASPAEIRATFVERGHQRIPVYEGSLDNVVGYLSWRDVISAAWQGTAVAIEPLLRPALFVPDTRPSADLLTDMRQKRVHLAIVVDEHGGMEGIVTLEDLLEELVGEIHSEHASTGAGAIVREPGGTLLVQGLALIREVNREPGLHLDEPDDVITIGGLCVQLAGDRMPRIGDRLTASDGTVLEIVDASPRRVRSVRLHRMPEPSPAPDERATGT